MDTSAVADHIALSEAENLPLGITVELNKLFNNADLVLLSLVSLTKCWNS